jgi:hypothetical protein
MIIEYASANKVIKVDSTLPFVWECINDTGPESGATCPHCGAEGRYIYNWFEFGERRAAMAGCFEAMTGRIKKCDKTRVMLLIAKKQSRNKPLNGWERSILRMEQFKSAGKYPAEWCDQKISETLSQRKSFLAKSGKSW